MKLKPQPRPATPGAARGRSGRSRPRVPARIGPRPRGRHARLPGVTLRHRLGRRIPAWRRLLAGLSAGALAAVLVALVNGPWLRVAEIAWSGERYTDPNELTLVLAPERGAALLTIDTATLRERLEGLPAVAEARVEALLPRTLRATLVERSPAFVWQTSAARLLAATDGTLIAEAPPPGARPEVVSLPVVDDARDLSRLLRVGDRLPAALVETAMRLADVEPAALGSATTDLRLRIEDQYGFVLVSDAGAWRIAFGFYPHDPRDVGAAEPAEIAARIERQVAAVRTLFATEPEAGITWVDARNPGKVYFRDKG